MKEISKYDLIFATILIFVIFGAIVISFHVNSLEELQNNITLVVEIAVGLVIAIILWLFSTKSERRTKGQIKEVGDLVKKVVDVNDKIEIREARNRKYLEGQLVRSLVHIRTELHKTIEELIRMANSAAYDMAVADMIWVGLGKASIERLESLIQASTGISDAKTLDKINAVIAELKIKLSRDNASAQGQAMIIEDLVKQILTIDLNEAREGVITELKEHLENDLKRWAKKGISEKATAPQRIFGETVIKQLELDDS